MIENALERLRKQKPLIHHITNEVTIDDCANATLCTGALPVMTHAVDEVEEMVAASDALVINIGTPVPEQIEAMILAGKKATELNIPVILDPVGIGATQLRTEIIERLAENVNISVIKGNKGEISVLANMGGKVKGVESIGEYKEIHKACRIVSEKYNCVAIASGVIDIITDSRDIYEVNNGHTMLGHVVGTGCMSSSVLGAFAALKENITMSSVTALAFFGTAGQIAAERDDVKGPGTFKAAFFDELYNMTDEKLKKYLDVNHING
jgi:hydroxyethylthiazole kinase